MPRTLVSCHQYSSEIEICLVLYHGSCLSNEGMPRYKSNVQKSIELTSLYVTRITFDTQTLSEVNLWIPKTSAQVYDSHRSIPCLDTILVIYVRQFKTIVIHG